MDILTSILLQNIKKKLKGDGPFGDMKNFPKKTSRNAERSERKDPLGFFNSNNVTKHQKLTDKKDPLEKKIKKSLTVPAKLKGGPLSLSLYCMLR